MSKRYLDRMMGHLRYRGVKTC